MGSSTASETKKRESETKIYDSATKTRDSETNATSIQKPMLRRFRNQSYVDSETKTERFRHQLRRDSESKTYDSETKTSETKMLHYKRSTPPPPLNNTSVWSSQEINPATPSEHYVS